MSEHVSPGIHSLTDEQYRRAAGLNISTLLTLQNDTPAHLKCILDGQAEPEQTEALSFGTLFHDWTLRREIVEGTFHVKPANMNFATKEGKAWKADHSDKPIVLEDDIKSIRAMSDALRRNKRFMQLYRGGEPERAIFVQDENGVIRKMRLDYLTGPCNYTLDIKSCESCSRRAAAKAIDKYSYDVRMAYYTDGCNLAGMTPKKEIAYLVFVEKRPPFCSKVYRLNQLWLQHGRKTYQKYLATYRHCLKTGNWPDYSDEEELIGPEMLSKYRFEEIEQIASH